MCSCYFRSEHNGLDGIEIQNKKILVRCVCVCVCTVLNSEGEVFPGALTSRQSYWGVEERLHAFWIESRSGFCGEGEQNCKGANPRPVSLITV